MQIKLFQFKQNLYTILYVLLTSHKIIQSFLFYTFHNKKLPSVEEENKQQENSLQLFSITLCICFKTVADFSDKMKGRKIKKSNVKPLQKCVRADIYS